MNNNYIPKVVRIERIFEEAPNVNTFYIKERLEFIPGQFLEISYFGIGESPISIASCPGEEFLRISFKRVGGLTNNLFDLKEGDSIGIRGPFGNGFPLGDLDEKDIIFIAGGMGMAPLRSLLKFIFCKKQGNISSLTLLYGARRPQDILYKKELEELGENIKVLLTVDKPEAGWQGHTGVVPKLLDKIELNPLNTRAFICGPEIMMRFTVAKLLKTGIPSSDIIFSLERYMKCGVGKCGHCYIADKFVCRDGPVFNYKQLSDLSPAEIL